MQWHNEPWRKIYPRQESGWLALSQSARSLASDLIKYADTTGALCTVPDGRHPGDVIGRVCCAWPEEYERLRNSVDELLADGYLMLRRKQLVIRNFGEAQERKSPGAIRQQRYRDKDKRDRATDGNGSGGEGGMGDGNGSVTNNVTGNGERDTGSDKAGNGSVTGYRVVSCRDVTKKDTNAQLPLRTGPPQGEGLDFAAVYAAYPRKRGKTPGLKICRREIRTPADFFALRRAVENYAATCRREQTPPDKIKHFSTFMGQWRDFLEPEAPEIGAQDEPRDPDIASPAEQARILAEHNARALAEDRARVREDA